MSEPEPVWAPLEKVALLSRHHPDLPPFHECEFMYMYSQPETGRYRVHAYKHCDTRKYIHLDDAGRPSGHGGFAAVAAAIAGVGLEDFYNEVHLFRSAPPEVWPPDDPAAVAQVLGEWE
jgi:hypothetical protein